TDSGELKTLAELDIVSIGTGKTSVNVTDEHGNLNTFKGDYTKSSGVVTDGARAFNLVENPFYRVWPGSITLRPGVENLPNMQGSGAVRDLHEAMSVRDPATGDFTAEANALFATVTAFSNATTRSAQYALIDQM